MCSRWRAGHRILLIAAPLLLAAMLTGLGLGVASAATCVSWTGMQPSNPSSSTNVLQGVAVASSCRAWTVGYYSNGTAYQTLIARWNGSSWAQESSPNPGGSTRDNYLLGATATSASNAWAVGYYHKGTAYQTLIARWNGTIWAQLPSPNPGGSTRHNLLQGVTAISASNAWAVGDYSNGTAYQTLIARWNGTTWKRVPSPNPGGSTRHNQLLGVTAISASNAWAVGYYDTGTSHQTLIAHWNGTTWTQVPSPNPSPTFNALHGVVAISSTNAWAVGQYDKDTVSQTLIVHWNGSTWTQVPSPNLGVSAFLRGVDATSASSIWAVGAYHPSRATYQTLALHCC